jgi:ATP-dependent Lon protease
MSTESEVVLSEKLLQSNIPVLPLRDVVVYPHMVIPLFVGRDKSIKALEAAMVDNKHIFLVAQRKSANDDPTPDDLFTFGTISSVLQLLKLPDGTVKVLVEGEQRAKVVSYVQEDLGHLWKMLMNLVRHLRRRKLKLWCGHLCLNLNSILN